MKSALTLPRTRQEPRPPLWLAGSGPKMPRLVARHADWACFGIELDDFRYRTDFLHQQCEAVTRNPNEIGLSTVVDVFVADTSDAAARLLNRVVTGARRGSPPAPPSSG